MPQGVVDLLEVIQINKKQIAPLLHCAELVSRQLEMKLQLLQQAVAVVQPGKAIVHGDLFELRRFSRHYIVHVFELVAHHKAGVVEHIQLIVLIQALVHRVNQLARVIETTIGQQRQCLRQTPQAHNRAPQSARHRGTENQGAQNREQQQQFHGSADMFHLLGNILNKHKLRALFADIHPHGADIELAIVLFVQACPLQPIQSLHLIGHPAQQRQHTLPGSERQHLSLPGRQILDTRDI